MHSFNIVRTPSDSAPPADSAATVRHIFYDVPENRPWDAGPFGESPFHLCPVPVPVSDTAY